MKTKLILILFFVGNALYLFANPPIDEGKKIFMSRCAACHTVNKALTGPALAGVDARRPIEWIIQFVHSSQTLIKKGDKEAVAVFTKFNKVPMPDHPDLTDSNIKSIVEYIKSESKAVTEEKAPFARPGKKKTAYLPISINNYGFVTGYLLAVIALMAALYFAVQAKTFALNKRGDNVSA
jgi:cytochrome c551/c552